MTSQWMAFKCLTDAFNCNLVVPQIALQNIISRMRQVHTHINFNLEMMHKLCYKHSMTHCVHKHENKLDMIALHNALFFIVFQ